MAAHSNSAKSPVVPICGIGASAGGIEALQQFFDVIPDNLGLAYVVVVHLAPDRKSELPAILQRYTSMPVTQVADHEKAPLQPNNVYVIAPDRRLEITDSFIGASAFEQPRGRRAAIDLFFRSLAHKCGDGFAVVLSGSGSDGSLGAKAIKEEGGVVLVQDPQEAAYGDMPRSVISSGSADVILPVRELANALSDLARNKMEMLNEMPRVYDGVLEQDEEKALKGVLDLLHKRTGHDFSKYKRNTVLRRLSRRLQLNHQSTIVGYLEFSRTQPDEVQALFDDLLISVTTFFRDPEAWADLQAKVVGPLFENSENEDQIRAWVVGCATGEEAYSLAILFNEELERRKLHRDFIIFASDVDESALAIAREGLYPLAINTDVSEARLNRYFRTEEDCFRVKSEIRDHVVFAAHSVLRDPPFSRLNLITCRNLLIYLDRDLQEQVMGLFRYAGVSQAALFLGAAELADEELFETTDKKSRIFRARPKPDGTPALPELLTVPGNRATKFGRDVRLPARLTPAEIHLSALEAMSPPSVVIDDSWNVLHLSSSAARFFQQGGGALARRITDLVRPELRDELHTLLHRTLEQTDPQLSAFVLVNFDRHHRVGMLAQQRPRSDDGRAMTLVTFLDAGSAQGEIPVVEQEPPNELVRGLREKLRHSEQRVENMRDDYHATNEDLRAANEELQSLNEEYRSTTEELETSKEELQSINEELQTVNNELKTNLEDVSRAHSDLENLMASTDLATLFLDVNLRIKRFTPRLEDIFNIKMRDYDRPIGDLTHSLKYDQLQGDARRVLTDLQPIEREIVNQSGQVYIARLRPYRTSGEGRVDGIVITFIDVSAIKSAELALRESEQKLESELNVMRRLHAMTMSVATAPSMTNSLEFILAAAIELHGAQMGNIQLLDRAAQKLRIVAHKGFLQPFLDRFEWVDSTDRTACGRAWSSFAPCRITDIEQDADYAPFLNNAREAGYRAVQSTPLVDRSGIFVGILSVHFREPHVFSERDRQLSDFLGQQAADLIESRAQQDSVTQLVDTLNARTLELEASQKRLTKQASDLLEQDHHRDDFLAALGHELRNPLSALQNSVTVLNTPSLGQNQFQLAVGVLRRQIRHMTRLINDLLDSTRIKHGRLRLERTSVDLNSCAESALDTIRAQAEVKRLTIEYSPPKEAIIVNADQERLAQIIDNLLRNAVTYTDSGTVTLSIATKGSFARVTVRDTGVGIDSASAAELFKPYYQHDDGKRSTGLGLGLALVKGLVEAHNGTITVQSDGPGKGSAFSFTIPLATAAIDMDTDQVKILRMPAPRRVLVVDDQQDVADMFGALLKGLNQDVTVAYSGAAALDLVLEQPPEVAFVDMAMPDMDGVELARQFRAKFTADQLVLVGVSGHNRIHASVGELDVDHYLLKPVSAESLIALLNSLPN